MPQPGKLKYGEGEKDFVSVWEDSGLGLVTKKIKDDSSKGMFAKSTTVNKRLDQKGREGPCNITPETLIAP